MSEDRNNPFNDPLVTGYNPQGSGQGTNNNPFGDPSAEQWGGVPFRPGQPEKQRREVPSWALGPGLIEPAATVLSGYMTEPVAGAAGLAASIVPGGRSGPEMVEAVRDEWPYYQPRSVQGRNNLQKLGKVLEPFSQVMENLKEPLRENFGDVGESIGGERGRQIGSAVGGTLPTLVTELAGVRGVTSANRFARRQPSEAQSRVISEGQARGVPVLATDVAQPQTWAGRWAQQFSEKLGPLGSGPARGRQQVARESAVQGLADEFNIELDSPFALRMVNSINAKSTRRLEEAGRQRAAAVASLSQFGDVPLDRTLTAIQEQIQRQVRLGDRADPAVIKKLEATASALAGGDFDQLRLVRSEIISDVRAARRDVDSRQEPIWQSIKSNLDKDMLSFGRANDRDSTRQWLRSNRTFAEELGVVRDTELRRVLNKGDATPEVVLPILSRGNESELNRLYNAMGENGRAAARAAILQDALDKSGFFSGDLNNINPDRFATRMLRPDTQIATSVFFRGEDFQAIDGLTRLLDATRRAQQAGTVTPTGMQNVPLAAAGLGGWSMQTNPVETLVAAGTLAAFAKAYESGPMRSILVRIGKTPPGSDLETKLLGLAVPLTVSGLQAARRESQEKEEQGL